MFVKREPHERERETTAKRERMDEREFQDGFVGTKDCKETPKKRTSLQSHNINYQISLGKN